MKIEQQHEWVLTTEDAIVIQQELRQAVITQDQFGAVNYVAGIDVGFEEDGATTRAAVAILTYPELEFCDSAIAHRPTTFPSTLR